MVAKGWLNYVSLAQEIEFLTTSWPIGGNEAYPVYLMGPQVSNASKLPVKYLQQARKKSKELQKD